MQPGQPSGWQRKRSFQLDNTYTEELQQPPVAWPTSSNPFSIPEHYQQVPTQQFNPGQSSDNPAVQPAPEGKFYGQTDYSPSSSGYPSSLQGGMPFENAEPREPNQPVSQEQPSELTPLKRGQACKFCRKRKLRCSGERPKCTSCIKYKQICEYLPSAKSNRVNPTRSTEMNRGFGHYSQGSTPYDSLDPKLNNTSVIYPNVGGLIHPSTSAGPSAFAPATDIYPHSSFNANAYMSYSNGTQGVFLPSALSQETAVDSMGNPVGSIVPHSPRPAEMMSSFGSNYLSISPNLSIINSQSSEFNPTIVANLPSIRDINVIADAGSHNVQFHNPSSAFEQPATPVPLADSARIDTSSSSTTGTSISPEFNFTSSTSSSVTSNSAFATTTPNIDSHPPATSCLPGGGTDPVESLTQNLGEFLFRPRTPAAGNDNNAEADASYNPDGPKPKTPRNRDGQPMMRKRVASDSNKHTSILHIETESDGLNDQQRNLLIECFLTQRRLFFDMNIPRFRYRMGFTDKRRPSLALLNAMYLWATRFTQTPNVAAMQQHFYSEATRHLDAAAASNDRLLDVIRAAMLLSAHTYTNGRYHEGWLFSGIAVRLVLSTGIHRIPSLTLKTFPPDNLFLRNRPFLLPPPEDSIELAERVHAFWSVYATERCGALATGFPSSINDDDIATPFPALLDDIASQSVTLQNDVTVRDLYRNTSPSTNLDSPYIRWMKALTILERTSKLAFLDPDPISDYSRAWLEYTNLLSGPNAPTASPPPQWLNQPKYRNPKEYNDCLSALSRLRESLGADGLSPVEMKKAADADGVELVIDAKNILLHHHFAAIEMLLHDINSADADNKVSLQAARKSVDIFRYLPQLAFHEVDAEICLVWCMVTKIMIKELERYTRLGDVTSYKDITEDIDVIIGELHRIGFAMPLARTQAMAMEEFKRLAIAASQKL
ncbi:hypothetical protein L204_104359 [Cryptococcus depauperatus]|nr:hypothetical protein L204_04811 [Cryptococcus depauperatus CBS 7855]